jgi:peptidoglycan/LPS O-acetylase OafA/YrhL
MKNDSPNLDALRTIAVSLVVVSHISPLMGVDALFTFNWYTFGRLGVALFFVHTTLVLMMSLERHGSAALPFYVRRFFRIWPLAAFMVLVMAALHLRFHETVTLPQVIANLLLVQNFTGHVSMPDQLWTLPFEVQMYLFLPALFLLARRSLGWVIALCAGVLTLGLLAFVTVWSAHTDIATPLHYIPCFLPGVLAYALMRHWRGTLSPWALFSFIAAAAVIAPMLVTAGVPETPLFWVVCLLLGVLIPTCREMKTGAIARGAHLVATYSYGIYLTHVLAFWLGFAGLMESQPVAMRWAMALLMLAGLPFALYRTIEQPCIRLGARLAAAMTIRRTSAPAQTAHQSAAT